MMTINSGNAVSQKAGGNISAGGLGMGMQADSVSKSIQNQIISAQEQLQALASNEDMTLEEKMRKRQEIQQEITSLNQQLRQHQIQQQKEQREKRASSNNQQKESAKQGTPGAGGSQGSGLSQASMQTMLSADTSLKQAKVQGSVAQRMEGKANVLKIEIKLDKTNTERKEAELADIEQKAVDAAAAQAGTLADTNQEIKEGMKEEQAEKKEEGKNESDTAIQNQKVHDDVENAGADASGAVSSATGYRPVDVRL